MTASSDNSSRLKPMRGVFAMLSPQQTARLLAYRGSDAVAAMHPAAEEPIRSAVDKPAATR